MAREQNPETIVAASMRIEGELKSHGSIRIDGIVSGKIQTQQDLIAGPTAQIDADILAANAIIGGIVRGNITAKGSLIILETGKVIGNINCSSLGIMEGAYFSGACKMNEPKQNEPKIEE
jgi:cytoskeletal protein CcmA (bactofilin family)